MFLFLFYAAFLFLRSRRQPPAALFLRLLKKAAGFLFLFCLGSRLLKKAFLFRRLLICARQNKNKKQEGKARGGETTFILK
jgi:hypothetical protein